MKKGFTLVEILIVVALIGLLAAIGMPSVTKAYASSQATAKKRNITDIEKAKAMLTLPPEAGGKGLVPGDTVDDAYIIEALNLDSLDDLTINGKAPVIGKIGSPASY